MALPKNEVLDLRNEFVPVGKCDKPTWKSKSSIPLDKDIRSAIKKKESSHRSWMQSIKRNQALREHHRCRYTKARNKVNNLLRRAKRKLEREIALKAKTNPKAFWLHTRRSLKTKSGIAPLLEDPKNKESMRFNDAEKCRE